MSGGIEDPSEYVQRVLAMFPPESPDDLEEWWPQVKYGTFEFTPLNFYLFLRWCGLFDPFKDFARSQSNDEEDLDLFRRMHEYKTQDELREQLHLIEIIVETQGGLFSDEDEEPPDSNTLDFS